MTYTPKGGKAVSLEVASGSGGEYSFKMPAADVTVSATFDRVNMVYVDFGEGHEDFVQRMYGSVVGYEVKGSAVSFQYVSDSPDLDNAYGAYATFEKGPDQSLDPVDGGVCYMYDVALHTRDHYADQGALDEEQRGYQDMPVTDGITFHALWADPIKAKITVTPPECGTEVTMAYKTGIYVWAQPGPQLEVEGQCHFEDYALFFNSWDLSEYGVKSVGDSLVIEAGNAYKATGHLSSDWGSYIPADTSAITVKGGTLESVEGHGRTMVGFTISVVVYGEGVTVYRMYNTRTSEHLYTTNTTEYGRCGKGTYVDWRAKGVAWRVPQKGTAGVAPVWRLYNTKDGNHHYTTSTGEKASLLASGDWRDEGVAFYSGGPVEVHRLYNGRLKRGLHHYTTRAGERNVLTKSHGWRSEGVGFYAVEA